MHYLLLTCFVLVLTWHVIPAVSHQPRSSSYTRPIIGIVAQDTKSVHGKTFIPVTYVSYLQQAGARVVPIKAGQPKEYYHKMINLTNGMLFPGGSVNFKTSLFSKAVTHIFNRAVEINQRGDYYPLWGTCMGFQILCFNAAGGINYLRRTDTDNITWPLDFTEEAATSRMFGNAPKDIMHFLSSEPITQNQHQYSILVKLFRATKLHLFFKALSTNKDRRGVEFISSIEARNFPFYGVQWHPEKNNFNWNPHYDINHDDHAVRVSQYMANFFLREARKSSHRFPNALSEAKNLIQNYKRVYFADGSFFENYYIDV